MFSFFKKKTAPVAIDSPAAPAVEATTVEARPAAEPEAERRGWLDKLRGGLRKTSPARRSTMRCTNNWSRRC
jgi:fused signal recognition particle receptor